MKKNQYHTEKEVHTKTVTDSKGNIICKERIEKVQTVQGPGCNKDCRMPIGPPPPKWTLTNAHALQKRVQERKKCYKVDYIFDPYIEKQSHYV